MRQQRSRESAARIRTYRPPTPRVHAQRCRSAAPMQARQLRRLAAVASALVGDRSPGRATAVAGLWMLQQAGTAAVPRQHALTRERLACYNDNDTHLTCGGRTSASEGGTRRRTRAPGAASRRCAQRHRHSQNESRRTLAAPVLTDAKLRRSRFASISAHTRREMTERTQRARRSTATVRAVTSAHATACRETMWCECAV